MSDSTVHDPAPDDLFRNRIAAALQQLDSPESDAEIEAALDLVVPEPLSSAASARILSKVQASIAATVNGATTGSSNHAVYRPDGRAGRVHTAPGNLQAFALIACLALVMLTGLIYSRSNVGRSDLARRGAEPLSKQLIATSRTANISSSVNVTQQVATGETITTGPREKRRFSLPDGSILSMNETTTVTVTGSRRIKLESGEVFVEVIPADLLETTGAASDRGRFVVETPGRQVTALGTKFVVKANEQSTNVIVTQGKVQVSGVGPIIAAGQELIADLLDSSSFQVRPARRSAYVVQWVRDLMTAANSFVVPTSEHSGGTITVIDPQGQEMKLSLRKYHVDVHIEDGFARTTIDQTYFNHSWQQLEGTFRFPFPADASLSRLAMYVNGTLMEGGMVERDYGRNVFEEIRHTRRDPALLEWVDGSTFQMRVFPLEARQEKRILLSYTQRLPGDYGKNCYRFPAGHNLEGVRDWSTHVRVKGGADTKWYSPSHLLESHSDGNDLVISGREQFAAFDRDLVLELGEESPASSRAADPVWSRFEQDGFQYLMVRLRPELKQSAVLPRRHWILLVENSADRNTVLAETQRHIARVLLENCEHRDQFSIVRAGTQPDLFRETPVDCSLSNVSAGIDFLKNVAPIGAMDLGQALQSVQQRANPATETYLVHLGTGIPVLGERDQTTLIRQLPAKIRYVGVAVGKRWSKSFMESAARQTGGMFVQINPDEAVAWRAFDLLSTLNAPRLTEIRVSTAGDRSSHSGGTGAAPAFLPLMTSLSHGQEFIAVTRLPIDQPLPASIGISGKVDGDDYSQALTVPSRNATTAASSSDLSTSPHPSVAKAGHLPRTWARLEIDRLVSQGMAENKAAIIELSKSMYVMSPFTSLLVLETEAMYAQYKVDRGRKDHWALYDAPAQIPVVAEPAPVQMTILDQAKDRLNQAKNRSQSAARNLERSIADRRPATDIKRLERVHQAELRDIKFLEEEIRRIELANAAAEDPARKAWSSVIQRSTVWQLGWQQANLLRYYGHPQVPLGWSDANLRWDDGLGISRPWPFNGSLHGNTDWYFWGETQQGPGEVRQRLMTYDFSSFPLMPRPGLLINGPGPGIVRPRVDGRGEGRFDRVPAFSDALSFQVSDHHGDLVGISLLQDGIPQVQYEQQLTGIPRYLVPIGQRSDRYTGSIDGEDAFYKRRVSDFVLNGVGLAADESKRIPVERWLRRMGKPASSLGGEWIGEGGFGWVPTSSPASVPLPQLSQLSPWIDQSGQTAEGIFRPQWRGYTDLGYDISTNGLMDFDSLIELNQSISGSWPVRSINGIDGPDLNGNSLLFIYPRRGYDNGRVTSFGDVEHLIRFGHVPLRVTTHPLTTVIKDLPSYAPGLQTWMSDRLAVAETAVNQTQTLGQVDPEARRLIENARSLTWQSIRLISTNGKPVRHHETIVADGQGRFRVDREVSEGLKETVIHDGTHLWHLYPEMGLGAKRLSSRHYQPAIQSLIPWYVPAVDVLAMNADIRAAGNRTVRIQPARQPDPATNKSETTVEDSRSESDKKAETAPVIAIELQFAVEGQLTELRLIDTNSNKVLSRQTLSTDGSLRFFDADDQPLGEARYELAPAKAPNLAPDSQDLVILPLPYRSAAGVGVEVPLNLQNNAPDFSRLSDDDALKLLATYFAEARVSELPAFIEQRFRSRGDKRIGFAVLVASVAYTNMVPNTTNPYPNVPLTLFLDQAVTLIPSGNTNGHMDVGSDAPSFLKRLAAAYNHYSRWTSGRTDAADRSEADVDQELKQTLQYVSDCRSLELAETILSAVHQRLNTSGRMKPEYARQLNATASAIATDRDIPAFARTARIEWSLLVGTPESETEAKNLLRAQILDAADAGRVPGLRPEIRAAFAKHFQTMDGQSCPPWASLVRETAVLMTAMKRPLSLTAMACQCVSLNESSLAAEIIQMAIQDQDLTAKSPLNLVVLEYAKLAKDWQLAEACLTRALDDPANQRDARLWRDAARVAHEQQKLSTWIENLEKAYEIEFADLPKTVNLESFRQDYQSLFQQLEERTDQLVDGTAADRLSLAMIVQRAANRWREIDPDDTNVCQRAARMLTRLGQTSAAWNYWTTPLAEAPDQSTAWMAFAAAMQSENRFVMADKAWLTAASCEPTNPEILVQHAQFLRTTRQEARAQALLKAIIAGTWQPRFAPTKAKAQELLTGHEPK